MRKVYFLVLILAGLISTGCGASECLSVCERWAECVDTPPGGVEACANECEVKADSNAVYRGHVEECLSCSEPLVCSEAEKSCAIDCTITILR
jgi:hypothetical protein